MLQQPVSVICFRVSWIKTTPIKLACLNEAKEHDVSNLCQSLRIACFRQSDLKAGQHSLWSLSSWHHAWEEDIKGGTYMGLWRLSSVLWGYFYIGWGQWQGSRCLLWVHRQGVLNCTQKQGGSTIGKLIGSAELEGKLAPTSFSCSYLVTVSSTLELQKF